MEDLIAVPSVIKRIFIKIFTGDSIDRFVSSNQIVNITNKSIQVNMMQEETEVPIFMFQGLTRVLTVYKANSYLSKLKNEDNQPVWKLSPVETLISPLNFIKDDTVIRSMGPFLRNTIAYDRLKEITTVQGDTYYTGPGMILDSEFNILLLAVVKGKVVSSIDGHFMFAVNESKVYLNPLVFIKKNFVEKNLAKNVIPCFVYNYIYSGKLFKETALLPEDRVGRLNSANVVLKDPTSLFLKDSAKLETPLDKDSIKDVLNNQFKNIQNQVIVSVQNGVPHLL